MPNPFGKPPETPPKQENEFTSEQMKTLSDLLLRARQAEADDDLDLAATLYREVKVMVLQIRAENSAGHEAPEFARLRREEAKRLQDFFGRSINVPPLPKEITPDKLKKWEQMGLKLHYLPPIDMSKEKIKGWIKPDFKYINESDLPADAMLLPGSWLLVDERAKPTYAGGDQMYENDTDFLGPVIEDLRQKGLIQAFKHPQSRFNISTKELENPRVIEAIAKAYNLKPEQIRLPRMIEFNILGNIHHPEWGETNCSEWFSDKHQAGLWRLLGGLSGRGGLADVRPYDSGNRDVSIGFRALGCFS